MSFQQIGEVANRVMDKVKQESVMSNAVAMARPNAGELMEQVIVKGDLSKLTPQERSQYYMQVCTSVGLNPLTKPFEYITLNNKLTLYALRACTDQLRSIHKVSVVDLIETERDGVFIVTAKMQNGEGRTDMAKGAVTINGLKGDALANAIMKAETKAKRRATLSLCGLGMLDESEVETIPLAAQAPAVVAEMKPSTSVRQLMRDDIKDMTGMSEADMRALYMQLLEELKTIPPDGMDDWFENKATSMAKLPIGWQQTLKRNADKRKPKDHDADGVVIETPRAKRQAFDAQHWLGELEGALTACETAADFDKLKKDMDTKKDLVTADVWAVAEAMYGDELGKFMGVEGE